MRRKSLVAISTIIMMVSLLLPAVFLAGPALAATWNPASTGGGIDGNYDLTDARASSMALYGAGPDLYVGTENPLTGCEVWMFDGASWKRVDPGSGFGDLNNIDATSMAACGANLYVGTENHATGCEVWEYNGTNWAQVNTDGFNNGNNVNAASMETWTWGTNFLYVGTEEFVNGCEVWEYNPGVPAWSQIVGPGSVLVPPVGSGFGYGTANSKASSMGDFVGLMVGTENPGVGCQVHEFGGPAITELVGPAGTLLGPGFGYGPDVEEASCMEVFNSVTGLLYIGTRVNAFGVTPPGCQLWEYNPFVGPPATMIEMVGPAGITNPPGFGVPGNDRLSSMYDFTGFGVPSLYVGVENYQTPGCEMWSWDGLVPGTWIPWVSIAGIFPSGFGNVNNVDIPCMAPHGPFLNMGTFNPKNLACEIWWCDGAGPPLPSTAPPGFAPSNNNRGADSMDFYGGDLYVGTYSESGCQVWSYNGTAWTELVGAGGATAAGFGDWNNRYVPSMEPYGANLYVGTENVNSALSCAQVWEYNGAAWAHVDGGWDGTMNNTAATSMAVYGGNLYVGTRNTAAGAQVWEYDGTIWNKVDDGWSGGGPADLNNVTAASMAVDSGYLYVGTENTVSGGEVWRTAAVGGPPYTDWTQVDTGWGGDPNNTTASSMSVYSGDLYVGTENSATGGEVWKYDGATWTQVNTNGFGDSSNVDALSMVTRDNGSGDNLYVGTENQITGGEPWCYDGSNWSQDYTDGFGDPNNERVSSMAVNGYDLYAGTRNQVTGCEVWGSGAVAPALTSITPNSGNNNGTVNITNLSGVGFQPGPTVKLMKTGEVDIDATSVTRVSQAKITCDFDLNGAKAGNWDVYVRNADGQSNTLASAFTINATNLTITSISPTAGEAGTTEVTIKGTSFGASRGTSNVSFGTAKVTGYSSWSDTEIVCMAPEGISGEVDVTVTRNGVASNSKTFTVTTPKWFLAEGTTAWGFDCYVTIENPNSTAVTAQVGYMTDAGLVTGPEVSLPAMSQATVNPRDTLGDKDFSTQVECKEEKTIAVDRTMSWTGTGAPSPDGHCSVGVNAPATTWYLAEGSSAWGFECWLLIQNPNPNEATCQVTYMIEGAGPQTFEKKVPAQSRKTYNMANDIGEKDASIKVTADMAVIPERAMYRNNRRSGHDSIGTTSPANDYYLAEGTTDWGFTTYVLVQNPNEDDTDVTVTYMTNSGPVPQAPFNMPANSRKTIRVNDVMPGADFSTQVSGTRPIIAERAMYWGEGTALGEASHDSIGLAAPHTTFYLPDGQTSDGRETYTLVMNPNATDVTVEVTYLTTDGKDNVVFTETVTANSRKTFSMADKGINGRAAVMVTCKTAGSKIMVERAMYWNTRGAGTDTIGGYSD